MAKADEHTQPQANPSARTVLTDPVHFLAFGFGSGLAPIAPGTFGTLAAIPLYMALTQLSLTMFLLVTLVTTLVGIPICHKSSEKLGVHDHSGIVWDEIAGYFVTMIPVFHLGINAMAIFLGFVAFRFFDIIKPWPIRVVDARAPGGFGIMIDDIIAGVFAGILMYLAAIYAPNLLH